GDSPPNNWQSIFGGPAWTRTNDGGEWYLHLFAPEQPDLNWTHPDVWEEHEDVLRFWFDRGAAGVRIDSAALLVKDPELAEETADAAPGEHPFTDRDELHDIYRRWRAVADRYAEQRTLIGEIWLPGAHAPVDARPTGLRWQHDVTRPVTRYGRVDSSFAVESKRAGTPTDLVRGTRRARAAALLAMALPGSLYVYQGEELGLPEVEDIPSDRRHDPMWHRSGGVDPGRDGCRLPLPWGGGRPPYALSRAGADRTWLEQPGDCDR